MDTDIETCAWERLTRVYMKDLRRKNALHASRVLSKRQLIQIPNIRETIIQQLADEYFSSAIVKEKIQESIAVQNRVGDDTRTYHSSLYVFTEDELSGILHDFALNIYMLKPSFPKPQTINESLI